MRSNFLLMFGCALFLQGAVSSLAQPFSLQTSPAIARWMYPNFYAPARGDASTFAGFGGIPDDDTRMGQFVLGWNTSNNIPAGQGARNYLISRVRVTLFISSEGGQYTYDNTLHDYRTYLLPTDPRYLPSTNASSPVELYGVGYRGGYTNSGGVYIPYSSATFQQSTTLFANPNADDYTNRTAYAACYDTNGVLVDVSDNVGDDGMNEVAHPFEVAPFAVGYNTNYAVGDLLPSDTPVTFDLNLNDPLIYSYVQQGLNQGNLNFMASSLLNADYYGAPNWPDFYTSFNQYISSGEFPAIEIEGSVIRTNIDTDSDGLPDDWEQFYFDQLGVGATNSFTSDGISNFAKYIAGTNPTNTADNFRLLTIQTETNATELHFNFAPSRQYAIQWSDDLLHWQSVTNPALNYSSAWLAKTGTNLVYPSPVFAVWHDTNAVNQQRFYRVAVQ